MGSSNSRESNIYNGRRGIRNDYYPTGFENYYPPNFQSGFAPFGSNFPGPGPSAGYMSGQAYNNFPGGAPSSNYNSSRESRKTQKQISKSEREQPIADYRYAHANEGGQYPISEFDLSVLQDPTFGPKHYGWRPFPRPIPMQHALLQLLGPHPMIESDEYLAALERLAIMNKQTLTWDLLIKCFNDLDTVIFHGDLRNRILLKWADMRTLDPSNPPLGRTELPRNWNTARIKICMATDIDWRDFRLHKFAMGVLVHEMLHAYFGVWCRDALEQTWEPGGDEAHGVLFSAAVRRIRKRFTVSTVTSASEAGPTNYAYIPFGCKNASLNELGGPKTKGSTQARRTRGTQLDYD